MTFNSLVGSTLAYNESAHWSRHHDSMYWFVLESDFQFAVINDFGDLVAVPWRAA